MSFTSLTTTWQERRSDFNHDWLKNKYLNGLTAFIERLQSSQPDRERLIEFLHHRFPSWEARRDQLTWLRDTFEDEMSPRRLFEVLPLNRCDEQTKTWLGELVHALWLARYPKKTSIQTVCAAFETADRQYEHLRRALKDVEMVEVAYLAGLLPDFCTFKESCLALSIAISRLPNHILVT